MINKLNKSIAKVPHFESNDFVLFIIQKLCHRKNPSTQNAVKTYFEEFILFLYSFFEKKEPKKLYHWFNLMTLRNH